jgi:hypothetical protein
VLGIKWQHPHPGCLQLDVAAVLTAPDSWSSSCLLHLYFALPVPVARWQHDSVFGSFVIAVLPVARFLLLLLLLLFVIFSFFLPVRCRLPPSRLCD